MHSILAILDDLLKKGVSVRVFPGAQAAVVDRAGRLVAAEAGREWLKNKAPRGYRGPVERGGPPIARRTLFDVASLTKLVTAALVMKLVERGDITFSTKFLAVMAGELSGVDRRELAPGMSQVEVGHLLAHSSGLPAWEAFYEKVYCPGRSWVWNRDAIRRASLLSTAMEPGTSHCYSDLGYILLHWMIESVTGRPFEELAQQWLFAPAGLGATCFGQSGAPIDSPVAATEECVFRDHVVQGEVHDLNTWAMGGISGHAGLFSTAEEIARLAGRLLGLHGSHPLVDPSVLRTALDPGSEFRAGSHLLGWDTKAQTGSAAGVILPPETTVGHLGFTGCSVWCDLATGATIVLLSNRVHPSSECTRIRAYRPWFHDQIITHL